MNKIICHIRGTFYSQNEYDKICSLVSANNNYVICNDFDIDESKIDLILYSISNQNNIEEILQYVDNENNAINQLMEKSPHKLIIYKSNVIDEELDLEEFYYYSHIISFDKLKNILDANGIVYASNETELIKELDNFIKTKSAIDSTNRHINKVSSFCNSIAMEIIKRGHTHDKSKFYSPEWQYFKEHDYELKTLEYGKQSYYDSIEKLKPAIEHHRSINSHHPEYYENGINDMDLVDIIEMLCDWKAATERCLDGNIYESLLINKEKYKIDDQLYKILLNTIKRKLGDIKDED